LLFPLFSDIAGSRLGQALMLRDGTMIDNVLEFEYEVHVREMSARWKLD
jgi:hypothetical protein